MNSFFASRSKWPMHIACFAEAAVLSVFSIYLAITFFQQKDFEVGVYRIQSESFLTTSYGSGFKVADPGYFVTNEHVIANNGRVSVIVREDDKKKKMLAEVVWISGDKDLAILKTREKFSGNNVTLADIDRTSPAKTSEVTAVGFPRVSDEMARDLNSRILDETTRLHSYLDPTVSRGTIQRLLPTAKRVLLQHSANINSGNSGGPLFDACQRVIGVNTLGAISTFSFRDVRDAQKRGGSIQVSNPGDLEFSVHVREVISALDERDIGYSGIVGQCYGGLDQSEMVTMGMSIALALACAFAGIYYQRQQSSPLPSQPNPQSVRGGYSGLRPIELLSEENESQIAAPGETYKFTRFASLVECDSGVRHVLDTILTGNPQITIGRDPDRSDYVIDNQSISRSHAKLTMSPDGFQIIDLGSTNGTFVDGSRVEPGAPNPLANGARLTLGQKEFRFEQTSDRDPSGPQSVSKWLISGFDHQGQTIQYEISSPIQPNALCAFLEVCRVGRDADNDLVLKDDAVSRHHAVIGFDEKNQLCLKDLGSSNGTFADGTKIAAQPYCIEESKTLQFGTKRLTLTKQ